MAEEETPQEVEETDETTAAAAVVGAAAKPPSKMGMMVVVGIGFLVMILTPLVSYLVVAATVPPAIGATEPTERMGETVVFDLDPATVNIAQTKATRLLRIEAHLVLSEARLLEELKLVKPMVIDRVMLAASRKTLDELEGPSGRATLKKDITAEINAVIKGKMSGVVVDVYFSEFLIQ